MEATFRYGTASRNRIGRPAFAKTGTSENWNDAWFVGGAGTDLVAAVAVFWPDFEIAMVPNCGGQQSRYVIEDGVVIPPICRETRLRVTGGIFPGQIWQLFMLSALEGIPASQLPVVENAVISVTIDTSRGCLPNPYTPENLIGRQTFIRGTEPTEVCTEPTGPQIGNVPKVVGFPEGEAITLLRNAGFTVKRETELSQLYPPGRVVRQNPESGEEAEVGSEITIWISVEGVTVPDVINETEEDAREDLEAKGFVVVVERGSGCSLNDPSCFVWDQDPDGDTNAKEGSTVTIKVKAPPPSPAP
jgi:membrane peptidoglycan carboxypeptidase